MATKKAASTTKKVAAKKAVAKKPVAKKPTTTKVKTVAAPAKRRVAMPGVLTQVGEPAYLARLIAEFVGTFLLAAVVISPQVNGSPIVAMFALVGIVLLLGRISGGYVNPALTIAAWATKRLSALSAIGYLLAQLAGGFIALTVMKAFIAAAPEAAPSMFGQPQAVELFKAVAIPAGKEWFVFAAEMLGAFVFGAAVASATRSADRVAAAFTVGMGLLLGGLIGGSAATIVGGGAILNPAVAIALQSFAKITPWALAVYVAASTIGATLGFAVYDLLHRSTKQQ